MVNTDNVIVPTELMNQVTALCDVIMGGGGAIVNRTAEAIRGEINKNGLEYYNPKSLKEQIAAIDTIGQCNIVQSWLDERKEQIRADIEKKALG